MQIPGYDIQHQLGKGGMAVVYLAVQQSLHRQVALKIMSSSLAANEEFSHRFIKEGQIVGRLSHPNIVTVFDIGVHDNQHYLSMEYLPGTTLKERIRSGEISTERALDIARTVANALGHAHQRGFIHRDIKPNNVLFRQDGTPVLTDFGVAKDLESTTQLTVTGITIGSINYMSPEQFRGGEIDARSDLYGLGVLFWEALTGELPYRTNSNDPFSIALKHANDPVPSLPEHLRRYQGLIDGLMAKHPEDRFADAETFIQALDELQQRSSEATNEATQAVPTDRTGRYAARREPTGTMKIPTASSTPTDQRRGAGGWIAALAVLAMLVGGGYLAMPWLQQLQHGQDLGNTAIEAPRLTTPSPEIAGNGRTDPLPDQPAPDNTRREPPVDTVVAANVIDPTPQPVPEPTPEPEPSIEELLARAEHQVQAGQYTEPAGDNAFQTYSQIMSLDPANEAARSGLLAIGQFRLGNRYQSMAQVSLDAGDLKASLEQIQTGLRLAPQHPGLQALQETVQAQLDAPASQ